MLCHILPPEVKWECETKANLSDCSLLQLLSGLVNVSMSTLESISCVLLLSLPSFSIKASPTVMLTGGKMTKSLYFARWFWRAGYKVTNGVVTFVDGCFPWSSLALLGVA